MYGCCCNGFAQGKLVRVPARISRRLPLELVEGCAQRFEGNDATCVSRVPEESAIFPKAGANVDYRLDIELASRLLLGGPLRSRGMPYEVRVRSASQHHEPLI